MTEKYSPVELISPRDVPLGGPRGLMVKRKLPQRQRSLIGAWCFVDHIVPTSHDTGMDVPPHPHTSLQTVSILFDGAIDHDDSAGGHNRTHPGEVNVMTAAEGIAHSEVSVQNFEHLHGVQLWVVLPEALRGSATRGLEHYAAPLTRFNGGRGHHYIGASPRINGQTVFPDSPVKIYSPLSLTELILEPHTQCTVQFPAAFEVGVLAENASVTVNTTVVQTSWIGVMDPVLDESGVPQEHSIVLTSCPEETRVILMAGTPYEEEIVMGGILLAEITMRLLP